MRGKHFSFLVVLICPARILRSRSLLDSVELNEDSSYCQSRSSLCPFAASKRFLVTTNIWWLGTVGRLGLAQGHPSPCADLHFLARVVPNPFLLKSAAQLRAPSAYPPCAICGHSALVSLAGPSTPLGRPLCTPHVLVCRRISRPFSKSIHDAF